MLLLSHQYETVVAMESTWSKLEELIQKYWSDAWKFIYDYAHAEDPESLYYQQLKKIVVHHSATDNCTVSTINNSHNQRTNWYNTSTVKINGIESDVSYHVIIQPDGTTQTLRWEEEVGRATKVNNIDTYHILFCWNFNETKPTVEQYKKWAKIIWELRSKYGELPVYGHNQLEGEATACPGKNFDYRMLSFYSSNAPVQVEDKQVETKTVSLAGKVEVKPQGYLGEFNITRYYSCDPKQTRYLPREVNVLKKKLGRDPSLEELYTECNRRQFNGDNDNTQPKHWAKFTNADAGIPVACPKSIPWRTKLKIEWYDQTVVCRDVWSAITAWRLDLYVWIWDRAVDHYNNFPSGKAKVFIIK